MCMGIMCLIICITVVVLLIFICRCSQSWSMWSQTYWCMFCSFSATTSLCFFIRVIWILSYFIPCDWSLWYFIFCFFLGIGPRSSDWDILEQLLSSQVVLGILNLMYFGSCSANLLSFELDNCTDLFLLSCFSVRFVSVCVADPDLSNEGTDIFLLSSFSVFSVTVEVDPDLSSEGT